MKSISKVTQKGQITIPQELRVRYGINLRDTVQLIPMDDHLVILPTQDILDIAGTFKSPKGKSVAGARKALESSYKRA